MPKAAITEQERKPRLSWRARLRQDVQYFHSQTGMKFTTFGSKSIKNPRFWKRFTDGGTITIEKADEIYDFMAAQGYHFNS